MEQQEFNFEINLEEGLKDKESAKKVVKQVQKAIDELLEANQLSKKAAENAVQLATNYEKQVDNLLQANTDLSDALKNVHIFLNSKRDLFKHDKAFVKFVEQLATWTLSSSAIKSGALSHKENKNESGE